MNSEAANIPHNAIRLPHNVRDPRSPEVHETAAKIVPVARFTALTRTSFESSQPVITQPVRRDWTGVCENRKVVCERCNSECCSNLLVSVLKNRLLTLVFYCGYNNSLLRVDSSFPYRFIFFCWIYLLLMDFYPLLINCSYHFIFLLSIYLRLHVKHSLDINYTTFFHTRSHSHAAGQKRPWRIIDYRQLQIPIDLQLLHCMPLVASSCIFPVTFHDVELPCSRTW